MTTRRTFLAQSTLAATGASFGFPRVGHAASHHVDPATIALADSEMRATAPEFLALAQRAVEAATAAGATYADARLTRSVKQELWNASMPRDTETIGIGVRAWVDGRWGFTASPYCDADEAVRLARAAVTQARLNATNGPPRTGADALARVELSRVPAATGVWSTPIRIDPFTIPVEEKNDFMMDMASQASQVLRRLGLGYDRSGQTAGGWGGPAMLFERGERMLATSDGTAVTQICYRGSAAFNFSLGLAGAGPASGFPWSARADHLEMRGVGYELVLDAKIPEQFASLFDQCEEQMRWQQTPGDIGRHDVICDAATMANLVAQTLGGNTQVDRVLGYEANASGTSYFGTDPLALLGSYRVGAPLLTVTANRSAPQGLATVKWDEDGLEPETFTLIQEGMLVDLQTTRDLAPLLASYDTKRGRPLRSHGCAWSESALHNTILQTPNLTLESGKTEMSFAELVAATKRGLAVQRGGAKMDFQGKNGVLQGVVREIVNGKLGKVVTGLAVVFNSAELWKSLQTLGGPASRMAMPYNAEKGQPVQSQRYTVSAVPALFTGLTAIDPLRKA